MIKDGINIKGFVRYKGDSKIHNFYDANRFEIDMGNEFPLKLIDTHMSVLNNEDEQWKYPTLYKFIFNIYENGYLISKRSSVFIRKDLFEWKLLSAQLKTYVSKLDITV